MRIKYISNNLTIYFNNNYPKCINKITYKKYTIFLGIGGNIGNMFKTFDSLLNIFKTNTKIDLLKTSPILKNPPFGYLEQDYFYNAIIKISTNMPPFYLLKNLQKYEKKFGRKRSFKDAPRTLDIDIIFIQKNGKNIFINHSDLITPHIGWKTRESVIIPLQYIENQNKYERNKYDKK